MSTAITTTGNQARCLRCGRRIKTGSYGRTCAAKIRQAAIAEAREGFTAEQQAKADELIRDGGIVAHPHKGVFLAVSTKGDATYLAHSAGCTCTAGLKGRRCYHQLSALILTIASRRSMTKAA